MSRARVCLLLMVLVSAACGEPPDKEMQQARGAIDAARAAGADVYASTEFTAAEDALRRAEAAATERDYRLALNYALDSRERAQNAAKQAADGKAAARVAADRRVTEATHALAALQTRLKADAPRLSARAIAGPKRAASDAGQRVQEARSALDQGDYAAAVAAATAANTALAAAARDLDAALAASGRRRR
jgi:hypothetical protein